MYTVWVIQESKLLPNCKNPCIRNYTTVRKDRPYLDCTNKLHPTIQNIQDKTINRQGRKLIEFCQTTDMIIVRWKVWYGRGRRT